MSGKLLVGKIVNTHGLKGHLRIYPYTSDKKDFNDFDYLMIEGGDKLQVQSVRYQKNLVIVLFDGYTSINEVEKFKNKEVFIDRADLGDMDQTSFIYSEVVGYDVRDVDRGSVGVIKNVNSGVAQDLIIVEKADGETFMIPCVKAFVQGFDHENKVLNVTLIEGIM